MQKIILPQTLTDLIPSQDVINHPTSGTFAVVPFIMATLNHLQATRQNLSTGDFVELIRSHLNITDRDFYINNICHALYCVVSLSALDPSFEDAAIYRLVNDWLYTNKPNIFSCYFFRNLNILEVDYPTKSTINTKKVAVWRNTSKMGSIKTRQAVSVRKWIKSTLVGLSERQIEDLAKKIDDALVPFSELKLDIRHHDSYDFEAWKNAYESDKIESCMSPTSRCDVGKQRTYTCYCTGYHGLPDNGLKLTVLYQDDVPVARAITFKDGDQNCFIASYGDDRLLKWLRSSGYEMSDFPQETILYSDSEMLKPYVDGEFIRRGDHLRSANGVYYWELLQEGYYKLNHTGAWAFEPSKCDCCGEYFDVADDEDDEVCSYESEVDGCDYDVCDNCYDNNSYDVYTGGSHAEVLFFHDGCPPDVNNHIIKYDGEYYHIGALEDYELIEIDDEIHCKDDLYYCEITEEYFTDRDDVYTDGDEISTTQPVHFPYDCVSREYWDSNVVECSDGTLALEEDAELVDGILQLA